MPDLPTFTVTSAQATRLLNAFGSTDNYKAWLRAQIIEFVLNKERQAEIVAAATAAQTKHDELTTALGGTVPTP